MIGGSIETKGLRDIDLLSGLKLVLSSFVLCIFAWSYVESLSFHERAAYLPRMVGLLGGTCVATSLLIDLWNVVRSGGSLSAGALSEGTSTLGAAVPGNRGAALLRVGRYGAWLLGFVGVLYLFGIFVATVLFVSSFLLIEARMRAWQVAIGVVCLSLGLYLFGHFMTLRWPASVFEVF